MELYIVLVQRGLGTDYACGLGATDTAGRPLRPPKERTANTTQIPLRDECRSDLCAMNVDAQYLLSAPPGSPPKYGPVTVAPRP